MSLGLRQRAASKMFFFEFHNSCLIVTCVRIVIHTVTYTNLSLRFGNWGFHGGQALDVDFLGKRWLL
jgi:hypothetical protein